MTPSRNSEKVPEFVVKYKKNPIYTIYIIPLYNTYDNQNDFTYIFLVDTHEDQDRLWLVYFQNFIYKKTKA